MQLKLKKTIPFEHWDFVCVCVHLNCFCRICIIYIGYVSLSPMSSLVSTALLRWTLSLLGPVIALFVVGSLVQFRIYGPVTNQNLGQRAGWVHVFFNLR